MGERADIFRGKTLLIQLFLASLSLVVLSIQVDARTYKGEIGRAHV